MARRTSRETIELIDRVRSAIASGKYAKGHFLPTIRSLSKDFGVSAETVRRGLKHLEGDGLVVSEPRQGFRVLDREQEAGDLSPIAYITEFESDLSNAQPATWAVNQALLNAVAMRNWTMLGAHYGGGNSSRVLDQVRSAGAGGVVLDAHDAGLLQAILDADLPVVMVNSWIEDADVDVVIQDNYRGGFLAARHLIDAGVERVAWLCPSAQTSHSRERHAGAAEALHMEGRRLEHEIRITSDDKRNRENVARILSGPNRVDGVLAFWRAGAITVKQVAEDLGLEMDKDLKLVGWSVEGFYETQHYGIFAGGPVPPAIVWSAGQMAEMALHCLEQRQRQRDRAPVRINLPTRLRSGASLLANGPGMLPAGR